MKKAKEKSGEMKTLRQERFPSGNPDLVETNAVPRCKDHDLVPMGNSWSGRNEYTARVVRPGNRVREDGRA